MFKHLKTKKKLDRSIAMKEARILDYDKEGRVEIDVGIKCADDFFSPYSYRTYEMMDPGVCEYINECESKIPQNENISLNIYCETVTDNNEKKSIRQTVKRHHAENILLINHELRRKMMLGLFCCLLGLIILLVEAVLYSMFLDYYLGTVIAVIGWLFLWDGLEIIFYDRGNLKRQRKQSYRIMNAKVHVRMYNKTIQRRYRIGQFEDEE